MRIQILLLPIEVGDDGKTVQPFAFIVDGYDGHPSEEDMAVWDRFREKCGARAGMLTPDTVEIRQEQRGASSAAPDPVSWSPMTKEQLAYLHDLAWGDRAERTLPKQ